MFINIVVAKLLTCVLLISAQAPCGYPPQQVSYTPQPQFPQNYTTPYPVAYPGTYPGAFSSSFNGNFEV